MSEPALPQVVVDRKDATTTSSIAQDQDDREVKELMQIFANMRKACREGIFQTS